MDKRTLIAIALIFIVFWLSNELIWKRNIKEEQPETVREEVMEKPAAKELPPLEKIVEPLTIPVSDIPVEEDIILSNEHISLHFTNKGAVLTKILLHDYTYQDLPVNLIPEEASVLGITVRGIDGYIDLSEQIFDWQKETIDGYPVLIFRLMQDELQIAQKSYYLIGDYRMLMNLEISNLGDTEGYIVSFDSGIADSEESLKHKDNDYKLIAQVQGVKNSLTLRQLGGRRKQEVIQGNVDWAAIKSKYFLKALIPDEQLQTEQLQTSIVNESPAYKLLVKAGRQSSVINDSYQFYFGPLIYSNLEDFGIGLEETMELGWKFIRPLGILFLWVITGINNYINNYGFTIIVFSFLLKIVMYPLTNKSFKSMQKMQKMQPYMQEIQKKYKSDPKKMQAELSKLYKEHGTHPMGGCFPMLLQMPVFFALFPILRYSIELRQASFILWITDLSEPDPLLILPIVMGLFMYIQQKITYSQRQIDKELMDDKQLAAMQSQKMMMYIMPVFMFFIFRGFPSGLVLYWTVFNVLSVIQQYTIKKQLAN